ncbi:hypothetical protein SSABA_v1c07060 [Spiroplasma sabaudiense Ar-1343]|uniref:2-oxoacid dehydrogenase acyltransferase catalytic domain-containing protein n=1 Tax=Spiroplasma sabaudiense Ar-1343 TaxID=1276257 RepID=W6AA91_9MOLU|nr:2-oxo acid dehydrogenase subunit E2 [Spiroplasma sabaudiense]AHI54108.1 hypothetical protein SSABA_v1c07060 [Spiroplasma sabaudiense Ar-1343]
MVHLRARNLPSKGILKKWLFQDNKIKVGEDFALITTNKGDVVIKSNYSGQIVKTIKLNSNIKNGSILANVLVEDEIVDDLEVEDDQNASKKRNSKEKSLEVPINIPDEEISKLQDAVDYRDDFSGAVLYDKNYMAITPFSSTRDDILQKPVNLDNIEKETGLDKFAQMRKNIAESIKNAPVSKEPQVSNEELAKINNSEVFKDTKSFEIDAATGTSKFRKIIEARKAKLLVENDFKEIPEEEKIKSAMDRLDANGRPMIMRNIINDRMKRLNDSGGDPKSLEAPNFVAPKVIRNKPEPKPKTVEELEGDNMWTAKKTEPSSNFEDFTEEDLVIDSNDLGGASTLRMPNKSPSQMMEENKGASSYNFKKLSSLYDTERRDAILGSRGQKNDIKNRMRSIMGENQDENDDNKMRADNLDFINSLPIMIEDVPERFLKKITEFDERRRVKRFVNYTDTEAGQIDFQDWLDRQNFSKHVEKDFDEMEKLLETDPETFQKQKAQKLATDETLQKAESDRLIAQAVEKAEKSMQKTVDKQKQEREIEQEKANQELLQLKLENSKLEEQLHLNTETSTYLEKEINNLKNQLKSVDKLEDIIDSMRHNNQKMPEKNSDEFFNKMMQYIMMQNMMQTITPNHSTNSSNFQNEIKEAIQANMKEFYRTFDSFNSNSDEASQTTNHQQADFDTTMQARPEFKQFTNPLTNQPLYQNQDLQKILFEQEQFKNKNSNYQYLNPKQNLPNQNNASQYANLESREDISLTRYPAVKSMLLSQNYIPPLSISSEVDMTAILKLKHVLKKTDSSGLAFSTIAFIAKAVSLALEQFPKINSSYDSSSNQQIIKNYHNIGLATETSEGLVVPVLKFVEKLSVKQVAIDIREMTARLRRGELFNYETTGSTITLANFGNVGAINATPTIFYPNAAVIGVGKVVKKPIVVESEKLAIKAIMSISLTVDQRIIDASEAGRFLACLKEILEKPELLMVR